MAALTPDDVSDILFTSGTTGNPKGAVCTHGQVVRAFADWAAVVGLRHGDRYLVINPFFHAFGYKAGIIASLTAGRHALPAERVRHPDRDGERGRAPDHDAPRARRRCTRRSSTTPTSTSRSCSRCASRSPARRRCRSSWSSG